VDDRLARLRAGFGSIRVRLTAAALIVVAAALAVSSVAMVAFLRRSLTEDVRNRAELRAESLAVSVDDDGSDDPFDIDEEDEFVQVVRDGRVVDSSVNVAGEPAVQVDPGESRRIDSFTLEDERSAFLAVGKPGDTDEDEPDVTVIVGRTLESVTESTRAVSALLIIGVPLLLLVMGLVLWRVVGRALAPVEAMREEVDAISTTELHRRVPDPGRGDEISRLAATMNRMLGRLERGQERQRRFVSDASHELRSPVTSIRQYAEVAESHPDQTTVEELAEVVLEENARVQNLVEDLLLLTQIDEGTLRLRTDPVDLDDLLFEEGRRFRGAPTKVITRDVSAGRVAGDARQLEKLVRNLTDNAARHCNGTVALSLGRRDGKVVLAVDDDGKGIPVSERKRIFERFVRLEEARGRDSGGSGLGLAIVAQIAAAHGATVSVGDGPLGGAHFEVRFNPFQG
jgi:signal transduction histidine kinase